MEKRLETGRGLETREMGSLLFVSDLTQCLRIFQGDLAVASVDHAFAGEFADDFGDGFADTADGGGEFIVGGENHQGAVWSGGGEGGGRQLEQFTGDPRAQAFSGQAVKVLVAALQGRDNVRRDFAQVFVRQFASADLVHARVGDGLGEVFAVDVGERFLAEVFAGFDVTQGQAVAFVIDGVNTHQTGAHAEQTLGPARVEDDRSGSVVDGVSQAHG
jgi:hypothetical protein